MTGYEFVVLVAFGLGMLAAGGLALKVIDWLTGNKSPWGPA